jgi:hypothetical protein
MAMSLLTPMPTGSYNVRIGQQTRPPTALEDVQAELQRALVWPPFNSAHEGYAVLAEEVDELWQHVKVNQKKRDLVAMRAEAIQVAAMALKFVDMLDKGRGRV